MKDGENNDSLFGLDLNGDGKADEWDDITAAVILDEIEKSEKEKSGGSGGFGHHDNDDKNDHNGCGTFLLFLLAIPVGAAGLIAGLIHFL